MVNSVENILESKFKIGRELKYTINIRKRLKTEVEITDVAPFSKECLLYAYTGHKFAI